MRTYEIPEGSNVFGVGSRSLRVRDETSGLQGVIGVCQEAK